MKPIGETNMFTGNYEKKRCFLNGEDSAVFRTIYENKDGELFVRNKGKWIPVICRGNYGNFYERDGSKRMYRVTYKLIETRCMKLEAESESEAMEIAQDIINEDEDGNISYGIDWDDEVVDAEETT